MLVVRWVGASYHAVRSVWSFVKVLISGMQSSGWDLDAAANSIHPGVKYWKQDHKCFAFESFVCRVMFDGFQQPNFSLPTECCVNNDDPRQRRRLFFERFMELRSIKGKDYLVQIPKSTFRKFCWVKYLRLVHPNMEASMFGGDINIQNMVNLCDFVDTEGGNGKLMSFSLALWSIWVLVVDGGANRWVLFGAFASLSIAALSKISMPSLIAASIFVAESGERKVFSLSTVNFYLYYASHLGYAVY